VAKSVADQFAETLSAARVKRVYEIVGDSLNGLTDAPCHTLDSCEGLHALHGQSPDQRPRR
jgi:pyruvate dehydrogenase (quinone)